MSDLAKRALHTFWQAFVPMISVALAAVHDWSTAKAALYSLGGAAIAAALSAVKTVLAPYVLAKIAAFKL